MKYIFDFIWKIILWLLAFIILSTASTLKVAWEFKLNPVMGKEGVLMFDLWKALFTTFDVFEINKYN